MATLATLLVALGSCGDRQDEGTSADPAAAVEVGDARWLIVTPPLEEVRVSALQILVNVEGLLGVIDLVRERYDVDLGDEDVLKHLGVAPDQPLVGLGFDEGTCLIIGVRDDAPLEEVLQRVGETSGYRIEQRSSELGVLTRVYEEERCLVSLLSLGRLSLLGYSPTGMADVLVARVALRHLPADAAGIEAPDGQFMFRWNGYGEAGDRALVRWPGPLAGVGHWLRHAGQGLERLEITLAADMDGIKWDLIIKPKVLPEAREVGQGIDWKDAVPDDAVLTLQLRDGADGSLESLLGGKGMFLLGLIAEEVLTPKLVPELRDRLGELSPELGLVFLGADPRASVQEILGPGDVLEALNAVHIGLLLRGTPPDAVMTRIPREDGPVAGGWTARVVSPKAPLAVEFCKRKGDRSLCLGVITGTDRLMLLSGKGETDRLAQVWSGRAPALSSSLFVGEVQGEVILTMKLKRLVRDMRSKGVPPFYLRMINSFLEVQAVQRRTPEGIHITGEVLLR